MRVPAFVAATIYASLCFTQAAIAQERMQHVLVMLPPLMPLVETVMRSGGGKPELLTNGARDAHTMMITPSQAEKINGADVIIIGDRGMNAAVTRMISKREAAGAVVIAFTELDGVDPKPYGAKNGFTGDVKPEEAPKSMLLPSAFDKPKKEPKPQIDGGGLDPHVWLDPIRMSYAVQSLAEKFGEIDPAHAETYRANAEKLAAHLKEEVDPAIRTQFENTVPASGDDVMPYVSYHDAYRYFERRYKINQTGYITQRPEEYIGAASMKALMEAAGAKQVRCIVAESKSPLAQRMAMSTNAQIVLLSPEILYAEKDTPDVAWARNDYDRLLAKITNTFAGCISGKLGGSPKK